jgi:hypothetical protein
MHVFNLVKLDLAFLWWSLWITPDHKLKIILSIILYSFHKVKILGVQPATKSQGGVGRRRIFVRGCGEGASPSREQEAGDLSIGTGSESELSGRGGLEHRVDQEESKRIWNRF